MDFPFREDLLKTTESYANSVPDCGPDTIDLSLGVNPFGFSESVSEAFRRLDHSVISKYPHSDVLEQAVVSYWKDTAPFQTDNLVFSNGSMCALFYACFLFYGSEKNEVAGYLPSFNDMIATVRKFGMSYVPVMARLQENGKLNAEDLISRITEKTAFVYLDRPNNPFGSTLPLTDVEKILAAARAKGAFVVTDEAYGDFIPREESSLMLRGRYDNLIVVRSFSKGFGLANLRAGYLVADKKLISILENSVALKILGDHTRELCASALLEPEHPVMHSTYFQNAKQRLRNAIGRRITMLETDDRVPICTLHLMDGGDLHAELMNKDLLTVSGAEFEGLDESYVRLRLPREDQLDSMLERIREIDLG